MGCPHTAEELEYWDGVSNPMSAACDDCSEFDCIHHPTGEYSYDPYEYYRYDNVRRLKTNRSRP